MLIDVILIIFIATVGINLSVRFKTEKSQHKQTISTPQQGAGEGIYRILNMSWEYKGV